MVVPSVQSSVTQASDQTGVKTGASISAAFCRSVIRRSTINLPSPGALLILSELMVAIIPSFLGASMVINILPNCMFSSF